MYRAPSDSVVLNAVLRLLPRHPEHIDAFMAYLANYDKSKAVASAASKYLESGVPYSYVRGELYHLLARIASPDQLLQALPIARQDARKRSDCMALSQRRSCYTSNIV